MTDLDLPYVLEECPVCGNDVDGTTYCSRECQAHDGEEDVAQEAL